MPDLNLTTLDGALAVVDVLMKELKLMKHRINRLCPGFMMDNSATLIATIEALPRPERTETAIREGSSG